MSEIGDIMEYNEEIEKSNKKKRNAKEHYYKYKEAHLKAQKKWKENNPEKVKEYEKRRYEKRKQLKQEVERLNNIINELEKLELYEYTPDYDYDENLVEGYTPFNIKDYIEELKGSDKE